MRVENCNPARWKIANVARVGLSGGVDGVLAERQIRWVAEDLVEHRHSLALRARDDPSRNPRKRPESFRC